MCARKAGVTKIGDSARARRQDFSGQTAEKGRVAGPQTLSQARGPGGRHPGRYVPALSALADGSRFCLFNPQLLSPYVGVRGFLARGYFILGRDVHYVPFLHVWRENTEEFDFDVSEFFGHWAEVEVS